jgi:hypothetical protein
MANESAGGQRNFRRIPIWFAWLAIVVAVPPYAASGEQPAPEREQIEYFEQHVRPLLSARCFSCHSAKAQKGNLRLDSRLAILAGGDSGPAVEVGDPKASLLISAVRHESFEMPPKQQLEAREIEALEHWITAGLAWPEQDVLASSPVSAADRDYWCFQPITDPQPPRVAEDRWSRNSVDRFIFAKLSAMGLTPAPPAAKEALIRRLYFDVLGLPPSLEDLEQFLNDTSVDAYEQLVDRVLSSPAYGERWGRHWLDLVRYAESDGFRQDAYRPNTWRYRDYVIRALNEDKPYDDFVSDQLAGDEANGENPERWLGTGYLRLHLYEYNQRDARTQRQDILNEITDVTGEVFLAFGFRCARCHDHKFDPLAQTDYFQLQAFFAALLPEDAVPIATPEEKARFDEQQRAWEAATADIRTQMAAIRAPYLKKAAESAIFKFPPDLKAIAYKPAEQRSPEETQLAYFIERQIAFEHQNIKLKDDDAKQMALLETELAKHAHLKPRAFEQADSVSDTGTVAPPVLVTKRTDLGPQVPGYPLAMRDRCPTPLPAPTAWGTTGRRTELANWLADAENPLPARVVANRIWQYHFGRGIVDTASDFGRLGGGPSHPELLDWLASRLIEADWHWKPVHRLILTSATYRQAATRANLVDCQAIDGSNALLWRYPPRRLSAEQIRDSLLAISQQLNTAQEGPAVANDAARRSIYLKVIRNAPHPLLALFDGVDGVNSTAQRNSTTTPNQALALMNDPWVHGVARSVGKQLSRRWELTDDGWIIELYQRLFARPPSDDELRTIRDFVSAGCDGSTSSPVDLMTDICHILLNSNEFVYLD